MLRMVGSLKSTVILNPLSNCKHAAVEAERAFMEICLVAKSYTITVNGA